MKDKILEILIDKIKATPHDFYPTGIEGLPQSAREIADMVQKFVEWLMMVITQEFFPQIADGGNTEYFDYYGKIKQKDDLVTLDELFTYWHKNIYNIKDKEK
jgi:hypothetical protein